MRAEENVKRLERLLALAGNLATAVDGMMRSDVLSLSARAKAVEEALLDYDCAILEDAKEKR